MIIEYIIIYYKIYIQINLYLQPQSIIHHNLYSKNNYSFKVLNIISSNSSKVILPL